MSGSVPVETNFKNAPVIGSIMDRIIDAVENGHDHDSDPVHYTCPRTGHDLNLGTFSRIREVDPDSTGTVIGQTRARLLRKVADLGVGKFR